MTSDSAGEAAVTPPRAVGPLGWRWERYTSISAPMNKDAARPKECGETERRLCPQGYQHRHAGQQFNALEKF
jgi:hypothetical protein